MPNRSELPNLALIPCLVSPPVHYTPYTLPDEAVAPTVVKEQWTRYILSTRHLSLLRVEAITRQQPSC